MPVSSVKVSANDDLKIDRSSGGLAASLRYLTQVTGGSSERMLLLDRELKVLFANRAIDAQNQAVEAHGKFFGELVPEHSREQVLACLRNVFSTGRPQLLEIDRSVQGSDAPKLTSQRYQEIRVSPVREGQEIVALTLNITDLTHHILAQRTLTTQAKIIEAMLEGVALIDADGAIVSTNPAFETLFGFERGVLTGWPLAQLAFAAEFDIDRLLIDDAQTGAVRRGAGPWPVEFTALRQDGVSVTLAGAVSRLREGAAEHRLIVLQDVSERKLLERAMLEAVSHEQYRIGNDLHDGLGQELTGIALMLRCLAGRLAAEHRPALTDVEGITRLVNNAVESTRSLARGLSPVNLERGGLRDALAGLVMHARSVYGIKAVFSNRMHPNIVLDEELANHLYRIAQEAVTNAVKHGRAKAVRLQLSSARRAVRLVIADDGAGMPTEASNATNTSGLGTRIMRYRARMAHGDLRFEHGQPGTRVVCECPIDQPELPRGNATKSRAAIRTSANIEDNISPRSSGARTARRSSKAGRIATASSSISGTRRTVRAAKTR
jgi:PAS domain S-box-containing protein